MFPSDFDIFLPPSCIAATWAHVRANGRFRVAVSDCAISFS